MTKKHEKDPSIDKLHTCDERAGSKYRSFFVLRHNSLSQLRCWLTRFSSDAVKGAITYKTKVLTLLGVVSWSLGKYAFHRGRSKECDPTMVGYRRGEWAVNNLDFGYVGLQRLNGNKDSVVLKVDSAIQRINHYPTDNSIGFTKLSRG